MDKIRDTLSEVIDAASQAVTKAGVPEKYEELAFQRALDVLLNIRDLVGVSGTGRQDYGTHPQEDGANTKQEDGDPLASVASKAGLPLVQIKDVFQFQDGDVGLVVAAKRIAKSNSEGSREITLLLAGGRQAAGLEEWTSLKLGRDACERYGRLDSKNYAASVKGMDNVFSFRGSGVGREVRVTMPGWDEWSGLVSRLLGAEG